MAVNAYEAILELPGVQNLRGGLELAGANKVTVVINGKVTNMGQSQLENLLKNMPKERIEKAEIMYSTPPQYHVRGAVINLVLKSGESDGERLQGQVNGLFSQGHYSNYQEGFQCRLCISLADLKSKNTKKWINHALGNSVLLAVYISFVENCYQ